MPTFEEPIERNSIIEKVRMASSRKMANGNGVYSHGVSEKNEIAEPACVSAELFSIACPAHSQQQPKSFVSVLSTRRFCSRVVRKFFVVTAHFWPIFPNHAQFHRTRM